MSKIERFDIQRRVVSHMVTTSWQNVPHVTFLYEPDITTFYHEYNGTVTVSNIGSLYKEQKGFFGLLEIIPPQIFAIGVGAIQEKPGVFIDDKGEMAIGIRKILPLCLVFDHRAVDFSAVVPFLKKTDQIFLKPDVIRKW
jgi:pyruvate/2-oxoglutarate dehydrogenase complex dihydrolipoamide acyltransferase (E2) component